MFNLRDLFQWERFITPSIIRIFFWLVVILALLAGFSGIVSALTVMRINLLVGAVMAIASIAGALLVIMAARIAAEYVLIMFRINDHLGALRNRAEM